jgi:4-diphosphocytidyl-2-C-methyl-D-erythritol kinase
VVSNRVSPIVLFSPAKLNLFLAVTGRRADGFHDLVSVVSPLAWGDTLQAAPAPDFTLECDEAAVPVDESNLILKAAHAFRGATGWRGGVYFRLEKRIPLGAGLGGGSSNAVTALRLLNTLAGEPLKSAALKELAVRLGSDCALFLEEGPVVMRGRGEHVSALPTAAADRLHGRRVLVFKPEFGIGTPWAYARLFALASAGAAAGSGDEPVYLLEKDAEARLAAWLANLSAPIDDLLFNSLERAAFTKYLALPALLKSLRDNFGLAPRMSGSGSACFALLPDNLAPDRVAAITTSIREAWGPGATVIETRLK